MDDQTLLKRYTATRDASAFEELAKRHAGFVKSVCQRVLGNSHDAEEVAQECFLELARHAGEVHSSVVGWLHRAAMSRSLNFLRSRSRRKVREREVGSETAAADESATAESGTDLVTRELRTVIEGALTEMPDDLRLPMLLHYFDGRSQRDVALELGVNQSTISRRMRDALEQLREKLTRSGYVTTAPALVVLMRQQAGAVESGLTEVAVSTVAESSAEAAWTLGGMKSLAVSVLSFCSVFLVDGWLSLVLAIGLTIQVARHRPQWMADLSASLGHADLYGQPTYCFQRWDWKVVPTDWSGQVLATFAKFVLIGVLTAAFVVSSSHVPWGSVILGTGIAAGYLVQTLRLVLRVGMLSMTSRSQLAGTGVAKNVLDVGRVQAISASTEMTSGEPILLWLDVIQLLGIGLGAVGMTLMLLMASAPSAVWPSGILMGVLGPAMLWDGAGVCRRLMRQSHDPGRHDADPYGPPRPATGTKLVLAIGVGTVGALTAWIVWNPASIRGASLSFASIQTAMLGWMFFRLAVYCRNLDARLVRTLALILLVGCFVLNSGVCLANCWR